MAPIRSCEPATQTMRHSQVYVEVYLGGQTCRVHLVVSGNVVLDQNWDSMERAILCELGFSKHLIVVDLPSNRARDSLLVETLGNVERIGVCFDDGVNCLIYLLNTREVCLLVMSDGAFREVKSDSPTFVSSTLVKCPPFRPSASWSSVASRRPGIVPDESLKCS